MTQVVDVGLNFYLNCHRDEDFDLSTACILKQVHHCQLDDNLFVYFCFPRLGVSVPLCPGDVLIFNSLEDNCIKSRVLLDEQLYFIFLSLKSRVVGLNNNETALLPKEKYFAEQLAKYY